MKPSGDVMPTTLKSIRAKFATDWMQLCAEYKVMGFADEPINPLHHETDATTRNYYAEKGSDSMLAARQRCVTKVKNGVWESQKWMKMWNMITEEIE